MTEEILRGLESKDLCVSCWRALLSAVMLSLSGNEKDIWYEQLVPIPHGQIHRFLKWRWPPTHRESNLLAARKFLMHWYSFCQSWTKKGTCWDDKKKKKKLHATNLLSMVLHCFPGKNFQKQSNEEISRKKNDTKLISQVINKIAKLVILWQNSSSSVEPVSYTHLTLPTKLEV